MLEDIQGIFPVLVTPFDDADRVHHSIYRTYLEFLKEEGVHGVVAGGSTGERFRLSDKEHRQIVETVRRGMDDMKWKVPLVVGATGKTTEDSIELAKHAQEHGASAVMVLPRFYPENGLKGLVSSDHFSIYDSAVIVQHYGAIADAVETPLMVYNNPGAIGLDLQPDLLARISERIGGGLVKESSGDMTRVHKTQRMSDYGMSVGCGYDPLALPMFMMGANFWIAPAANAIPKTCVALYDKVAKNEYGLARVIYDRTAPLLEFFEETGEYIGLSKLALEIEGIPVGTQRGDNELSSSLIPRLSGLIKRATYSD